MKEELKTRLQESADKLITWCEQTAVKGENFIGEQAPAVADEVIAWQFWGNLSLIIFSVSVALLIVGFAKLVWSVTEDWEKHPKNDGPREWSRVMSIIVATVSVVGMFGVTLFSGALVLKAVVSPKLVILDYLKELL